MEDKHIVDFRNSIHQKAKILIEELEGKAIEREILSRLMVLTILSKSHMFLIGEPGVGKTYLIKKILHSITNIKFLEHLMSDGTQPEEILGVPYKGENGNILYNVEDSIVDSHYVFLDELFKSSSKIINALLGITSNDRTFHMKGTGRGPVVTAVRSLFAASNEFPQTSDLNAFDDRLLFRYEPIAIKTIEGKKRYHKEDFDKSNDFSVKLTIDEIDSINIYAQDIEIPDFILNLIIQLHESFVAQRIKMSDRKVGNAREIMKVSAFCNNRSTLDISDVLLFLHLGWRNFFERGKIKEICYSTFFEDSKSINASVEENEQLLIKQKNVLDNEGDDIFNKRVRMDIDFLIRELPGWRESISLIASNLEYIDKKYVEMLNFFNGVTRIEKLVQNNIFLVDLLKEEEMKLEHPYARSWDAALVNRIEDQRVIISKSLKRCKHFLDNCVDYSSYGAYIPLGKNE